MGLLLIVGLVIWYAVKVVQRQQYRTAQPRRTTVNDSFASRRHPPVDRDRGRHPRHDVLVCPPLPDASQKRVELANGRECL
jgi:hypothetical protein